MKQFGSAIILAGGKSSRFGSDKAFAKVFDKPMIEFIMEQIEDFFDEIIIVTNTAEKYSEYNVKVVTDKIRGFGPLGGVYSGLLESTSYYTFTIACDMPFVSSEYIDVMKKEIEMTNSDGMVLKNKGFIEPFYSFYSKNCINEIEQIFESGKGSLINLIRKLNFTIGEGKKIEEYVPDLRIFTNVNRKEDLNRLLNDFNLSN